MALRAWARRARACSVFLTSLTGATGAAATGAAAGGPATFAAAGGTTVGGLDAWTTPAPASALAEVCTTAGRAAGFIPAVPLAAGFIPDVAWAAARAASMSLSALDGVSPQSVTDQVELAFSDRWAYRSALS